MTRHLPSLLVFLTIVMGGGIAIGIATAPGEWYGGLIKPAFNPPNWIFGPVWTTIFIAAAVTFVQAWRSPEATPATHRLLITVWLVNAALNVLLVESANGDVTLKVLDTAFLTENFEGPYGEDLVLLKKLRLIEAGVPASSLLMATVLDLRGARHAVLVLRTSGGDLVLDSLQDRIKHWVDTRYTFLKLQNPQSPGSWDAIFAGGRIPIEKASVIAMK